MNKELMKSIINKIEEYDTIAIYRHVFPDPDSYSSQTALKSIINNTYPNKKVVLLGEHSKNLEYINKMDEEIELDEKSLAIIVDVANKERVDNQSFNKCGYILKIDHHKAFDAPFEDLTWVDTNYSSCSEMILDLYLANSNKLKIDKQGRKALFTGIIGDTGRFLYIENPTELFEKLSKITFDLETKEIYANMYKREEEELKFLGYIYSNYVTTENGMAYLKIPNEIVKKYNLQAIKAARMVNALQDTVGIINWHFFAEKEDGSIFCEFRSNGPRVNDIAANFGGGGHMLAAGASLENWERVDEILKVLDENCKNFLKKAE
ncbi:bifunctional oligoribonuclease/PAP phosphatase NrnA [Clostridium celatum]|nr:bifunctional oligoribonuclease/PAP phosphatase NrnA [Clostridium celatum]MCE9654530.1 bifunctional oligoribonuclease/PAP phosphatase NrnA [Clostridium celatum]MDU3722786.1 bifunctional oligoribonuclease/PAP phosphatase NrnA [Clostridium celatum]MDU6294774.1 bifunctional oligoribonuclease/PAP phosphatase NrnA [Clostridium celatum]